MMHHSFGGSKVGDGILFCVQGFQRVFVGFLLSIKEDLVFRKKLC